MSDSVKSSTFGRIRGERPSERPEWSGTNSINEPRPFFVITPHGEIRRVVAITPALAINLVSPGNFNGCCVTEAPVVKCLGKCNRCSNPIWDGDRHEVKRKPGPKPKTWVHLLICEDCR
jgi:hypothetical protein